MAARVRSPKLPSASPVKCPNARNARCTSRFSSSDQFASSSAALMVGDGAEETGASTCGGAMAATVGADGTGGGAEIGGDCCEPAELGRAAVSGCDAVALG